MVTLNKAAGFDYSSNVGFYQLFYCFAYLHYVSVCLCVLLCERCMFWRVCVCQTLTQTSTAYVRCMIVRIILCCALWAA